ncbi:pentatricopeptide repeat-containing protein At4g21065-like [Cucurbita pepo subsp. pepo]|uniref:pentatricopeptide repeat-containing protein At4g21065-like n=1 Tax=Cucurbita pepo subsp. pepo TaxID=3664 RepID=UPI000C9D2815|nr:pentatricopeptide repeat-containing protein At4g21065-like [Cucurbita pepo subsp. pepo]XP_023538359.1 pentatricopeptide repeat-containing protein At4g21065-like [Cucurbita pepo subsp. pepo]
MASLPSVTLTAALNLDSDVRKRHSTSLLLKDKNASVSYQKNHSLIQLNVDAEPKFVDVREALSLLKEGTTVKTSYYVPLLQECIDRKLAAEAEIIHGHIVKTGTHEDLFVMTNLVNVYAKCGVMEKARKVFDNLPRRNVIAWTTLVTGYVQNSQPLPALKVFIEMLQAGAYPTNFTLGIVLNACSSLQSIELGKQVHAYIIKYHLDFDTSIGNSLSSFYSKFGCLELAIRAFQKIKEKNVISWTSVVSACGDNGQAARSLSFFTKMLSEGVEPNEYTLTSILSTCCVMLTLSLGAQIHSLSIKLGYGSSIPIKNSVMYLYLKCGWLIEAQKLFEGMETLNLITWNSMIAGHAKMMDAAEDDLAAHKSGSTALNMFQKLHRSGIKPDLFTFSSVLSICSRLVALEQGEQTHAQIIKSGVLADVVVGTALISMYNKCGSIAEARKAFLEMPSRTLISWTSMITGFARHGLSQQALQLFEDMRLAGVKPNQITFVGVLSACSHAGLVDEALYYFEVMQKQYKIEPVMDHFACMIDMYMRLGRVEEAFDVVKKMNFEPNEIIWSMLIAGCRSHGNSELGFYAAEQLLKLRPKDTETYISLLNMYISAGRWKDVSTVRKVMKEEKLGKLKDWSWISIKEKVYSFKPNDKSHCQTAEMYKLLETLLDEVKPLGYEPVQYMEVIEEEKGDETVFSSTIYHSEKLAIAFGLLNLPKATQIRVVKNITMCRDCHNFIRFVSLLTGREIVIRDSKQLHKFSNGYCSCRGFGDLL